MPPDRRLYAIAIEVQRKGHVKNPWKSEMHYLHAPDTAMAKKMFIQGETRSINIRIVGVAPAIGHFATDKHGERATAD